MTDNDRIGYSLFALRLGVFIVMFVWTLDKILNPGHAAGIYAHFYFVPKDFAQSMMLLFAITEMAIILAFLAGFKKRITYGLVLIFHTISTLSSWKIYMDPFGSPNMLFWAAWPMLGACIALYLMRDMDTKFTACCPCSKFCKKKDD